MAGRWLKFFVEIKGEGGGSGGVGILTRDPLGFPRFDFQQKKLDFFTIFILYP